MTEDWFFQQVNRPLGPGMPRESDGLATSGVEGVVAIGAVRGVNDRWARLVEAFQPTEYELVILGKHYLDEMMEVDFCYRCYGVSGSSEWRTPAFASPRLETIAHALGEEKFQAAIAKRLAEWHQKFEDADREEQLLEPCTKCGAKRSLCDLERADEASGLCGACVPDPAAALGPCASCGQPRGIAGSAYTGDLCWDCASERVAPCAQCGGKRLLSHQDRALCDECLRATVPPCKYCGAKRYPWSTEKDHGYCSNCTW